MHKHPLLQLEYEAVGMNSLKEVIGSTLKEKISPHEVDNTVHTKAACEA